jgi:transposase-like protein
MKNLLSENMMRFGTKNLTEAAKKELVLKSIMETINQHGLQKEVRNALTEAPEMAAADPNAGMAQKIVGTIWNAMTAQMGTNAPKILNAVMMIKDKAMYDSVLKIVKTSPKIKKEWGKNFPTVGAWIGTDLQEYGPDDMGAIDTKSNAIATKIRTHLQRVSGNEAEGLGTGGWDRGIDSMLRGE